MTRNIFLYDSIDDESVAKCVKAIIEINECDNGNEQSVVGYKRAPIKLYINSSGGTYESALALIDIMLTSKTPIHTICTGVAMSSAFNIYLAGSKRLATKRASFMYHQLSRSFGSDSVTSIARDLERSDTLMTIMHDFITERTLIEEKTLKRYDNENRNWIIDIDEAMELNIVTDLILYV